MYEVNSPVLHNEEEGLYFFDTRVSDGVDTVPKEFKFAGDANTINNFKDALQSKRNPEQDIRDFATAFYQITIHDY